MKTIIPTQVKTFQFKISNFYGNLISPFFFHTPSDFAEAVNTKIKPEITTEADIDKAINKFTKDVDVVDIKVNHYTIHRHNNGYCDTVMAVYTIVYRPR